MAMTADELKTLSGMAAAIGRIEETLAEHGNRLAALERSANRMDGALTALKVIGGMLGFGGITAIVWAIAQKGA